MDRLTYDPLPTEPDASMRSTIPIWAHAAVAGYQLLTSGASPSRTYFPRLTLNAP